MNLLYGVLFALIYTVGYVFLAMMVTGGGHGNFIVMAPVQISWTFNFAALILLMQLSHKPARIAFVLLLFVYYVLLFYTFKNAPKDKKMITHVPSLFIPAVWFAAGQAIMWAQFFRKIKKPKTPGL